MVQLQEFWSFQVDPEVQFIGQIDDEDQRDVTSNQQTEIFLSDIGETEKMRQFSDNQAYGYSGQEQFDVIPPEQILQGCLQSLINCIQYAHGLS